MNIKVGHAYKNGSPYSTSVLLEMNSLDWYAPERSKHWRGILDFTDSSVEVTKGDGELDTLNTGAMRLKHEGPDEYIERVRAIGDELERIDAALGRICDKLSGIKLGSLLKAFEAQI